MRRFGYAHGEADSRHQRSLSATLAAAGQLVRRVFSEFFDRPFGIEGATSPPGTRTSRHPRAGKVDITQFCSDATRELLQRAAQLALERGSLDLDTEHPAVPAAGPSSLARPLELMRAVRGLADQQAARFADAIDEHA